jgi:hypothetical protein
MLHKNSIHLWYENPSSGNTNWLNSFYFCTEQKIYYEVTYMVSFKTFSSHTVLSVDIVVQLLYHETVWNCTYLVWLNFLSVFLKYNQKKVTCSLGIIPVQWLNFIRRREVIIFSEVILTTLLWSSGQSSWLQIPGSIPGATRFSEK